MNERAVIVGSAIVGAALGAIAGYLFLTEDGRRLRRELEPRLDELAGDLARLQDALVSARAVATQGMRVISDVTGAGSAGEWRESTQSAAY